MCSQNFRIFERFEKRKAEHDMKKALRESKYVIRRKTARIGSLQTCIFLTLFYLLFFRRKEREQKAAKETKKDTKKRKAADAAAGDFASDLRFRLAAGFRACFPPVACFPPAAGLTDEAVAGALVFAQGDPLFSRGCAVEPVAAGGQ